MSQDLDAAAPTTCPACGQRTTRGEVVACDYACPRCAFELAHVETAPNGTVRNVVGWLRAPGEILGERYRVTHVLGKGGFAATYLVEDLRLDGKHRALKEIPSGLYDEFETRLLVKLRHPAIPDVSDRFDTDDMVYLVLEFGGSRTLEDERRACGGQVPLARLVPWIHQLCEVLSYLHAQDPPVIHRDLKPANVLLDENDRVMLIDFGIAKETDATVVTRTLARSSSSGFSPPEQALGGGTDERSDVYALGATVYVLLTGELPPPAHERVAGAPVAAASSLHPAVPADLDAELVTAMDLNLHHRHASIDEFAKGFLRATDGLVTPDRDVSPLDAPTQAIDPAVAPATRRAPAVASARERPERRVGPIWGGLALAVAGFVSALGIWLLIGGAGQDDAASSAEPEPAPVATAIPADEPAQPDTPLATEGLQGRYDSPEAVELIVAGELANNGLQHIAVTAQDPRSVTLANVRGEAEAEKARRLAHAAVPTLTQVQVGRSAPSAAVTPTAPPPSVAKSPPAARAGAAAQVSIRRLDTYRQIRHGRPLSYSVVYDVKPVRGREARVDEVVEIWRGGQLVSRTVAKSGVRKAGVNKSKARLAETRSLERGEYQLKFRVRSGARTLATSEAPLWIR